MAGTALGAKVLRDDCLGVIASARCLRLLLRIARFGSR
jgi:hypothetical protein